MSYLSRLAGRSDWEPAPQWLQSGVAAVIVGACCLYADWATPPESILPYILAAMTLSTLGWASLCLVLGDRPLAMFVFRSVAEGGPAYMAEQREAFERSPDYNYYLANHHAVRDQARSLPLRDGVLLVYLHNKFRLGPKPQDPNIGWKEAFPRTPALFVNLALRSVRRLIEDCMNTPVAIQLDRVAMAEFHRQHPGFSGDSYSRAFGYANFVMR